MDTPYGLSRCAGIVDNNSRRVSYEPAVGALPDTFLRYFLEHDNG